MPHVSSQKRFIDPLQLFDSLFNDCLWKMLGSLAIVDQQVSTSESARDFRFNSWALKLIFEHLFLDHKNCLNRPPAELFLFLFLLNNPVSHPLSLKWFMQCRWSSDDDRPQPDSQPDNHQPKSILNRRIIRILIKNTSDDTSAWTRFLQQSFLLVYLLKISRVALVSVSFVYHRQYQALGFRKHFQTVYFCVSGSEWENQWERDRHWATFLFG